MSQPGQGRARGRGGRGRKPQQEQPPPPGQAPAQQQAAQPPPGGAGAAPAAAPVGRGRSRGAPRQTAAAPTPQMQAQPPQMQAQPPHMQAQPPQMPAQQPAQEMLTGGRGVQRGGGRERPAAGGHGEPPTGAMAGMSIRGGDERRFRTPYEKFASPSFKAETKDAHGVTGDKCTLLTNYFRCSLPVEKKIYQYHVDFKPEVENVRVKYGLISSLSAIIGDDRCFDGGILYLCKRLENDPQSCFATRSYDSSQINVIFRFTCEVPTNSPQFLQIANLMFKKAQIALDMSLIRDHYFNTKLGVKIPTHKLEVIPGFTTSILNYEGGNLLGVDIVHKIINIDTFLDSLYNLFSNVRDKSQFHKQAEQQFIGNIVMTKYNNKTYRVDDINWNGRPSDTFMKNGEAMSYQFYYKEHWNIELTDKDQPLLVSKPTARDKRRGKTDNIFLIPELCTITGLSEKARTDYTIMRDLGQHTRVPPTERMVVLQKFLNQINESQKVQDVLRPFQMSFDRTPVTVNGRQLKAEELILKDNRGQLTRISYNIKEADWGRNMRNVSLLNPVHMENWMIIFPPRAVSNASELTDCLIRVGKGMGMRIGNPTVIELSDDRNDSFLQAIRHNLHNKVQMVVFVVPNNKKDRYDAIKKSCCIDNPVPSQVVVQKTLGKKQGLMSVATKIAIQMNCKMGGEVWGVEIPVKGLMICGIDSYHDSSEKGFAIGALVCSLNKECTRYYSKAERHTKKSDILTSLEALFGLALKKYHAVNNMMPAKIIVYRDGVGDGQLESVFEYEHKSIEAAVKASGGQGYNPDMGFIVVKKRIATRLFSREGNNLGNPQPGTLVDSVITKAEWYDFFLVSQSVRQGTVTPTSYNVIYDQTGLKPDHIQRLTYKLTHLYFNWQGTVRVPAPCQYAHKLAFLQGQSLHRDFSEHLADKLFYL